MWRLETRARRDRTLGLFLRGGGGRRRRRWRHGVQQALAGTHATLFALPFASAERLRLALDVHDRTALLRAQTRLPAIIVLVWFVIFAARVGLESTASWRISCVGCRCGSSRVIGGSDTATLSILCLRLKALCSGHVVRRVCGVLARSETSFV